MPKPIPGVKRYMPVRTPVEGLEWTGHNAADMLAFCGDAARGVGSMLGSFVVVTMHGTHTLVPGDYVFKTSNARVTALRGALLGRYYELLVDDLAVPRG